MHEEGRTLTGSHYRAPKQALHMRKRTRPATCSLIRVTGRRRRKSAAGMPMHHTTVARLPTCLPTTRTEACTVQYKGHLVRPAAPTAPSLTPCMHVATHDI